MTLRDATLDSRVMIDRCVRRSWRDPEAFFTALVLPVVLMLMFVYVFGGDLRSDGAYVDYVVPGLIVLCAGFGASTTAVAVARDMSTGIVDRFRSMPISRAAVLVGHVVASTARNLVATALVIGVAVAIGWRPTGSPVRWLAAMAMMTGLIVALSWLSAAIGMYARGPEAASSFTIALGFLPYVSSAFVHTRTMPAALRAIANHQPLTPIIETTRGLWMGHSSTGTSLTHDALLAVTYILAIVALSAMATTRRTSTWT